MSAPPAPPSWRIEAAATAIVNPANPDEMVSLPASIPATRRKRMAKWLAYALALDGELLNASELATLRAALAYYQRDGLGDPDCRPGLIHDLATDDGRVISLDDDGIDELEAKLEALMEGATR